MVVGSVHVTTSSPTPATKVPEISVAFWIVKILTTGLGETSSDFLVKTFDPIIVLPLAGLALAAAIALQWLSPRFSSVRYWLAVALVAVFGTMVADAVHVALGVPYAASTAGLGLALVVVFVAWHAIEKTLSIHSIVTRRREAFYWAAVLVTFALGTAAGDLTASTLGFGYFNSGLLFLILFLCPLVAQRLFRLDEVASFWTAYVLTRPLGASFADWIGVSHERGGLGLGTGIASVVLVILTSGIVSANKFNPAASQKVPIRP